MKQPLRLAGANDHDFAAERQALDDPQARLPSAVEARGVPCRGGARAHRSGVVEHDRNRGHHALLVIMMSGRHDPDDRTRDEQHRDKDNQHAQGQQQLVFEATPVARPAGRTHK